MVPPASSRVSRVPLYSGFCCVNSSFMYGAFTLFGRLSQNRSITLVESRPQSATPTVLLPLVWPLPISLATTPGISFDFFSCRYLDVSVHDVYLRIAMDSLYGDRGSLCRVSPFGHPRIAERLLLPVAFRSLLRPSSAAGAKAFTLCSF